MLITFLLTVIAWVFFRAETITHAFSYLQGMFSNTLFSMPLIRPTDIIMLVVAFIILEWIGRREQYAIEVLFQRKPRVVKWSFYMVLIAFILVFSNETPKEFIYFQF
ncbi:probable poly(beta-D-mannuronate) O-acetylase [Jejuia pallidilutea]|uniref:Probable poly(Beta-D-mannuronate) O-acetylase n=2 Tax=Jejuia pallidilutea TaxID=504487 RepID=A0A090VSA1_9FLAO|nr:probable poly(beta-D-mannuronate) O-acetylase [Jejuia pallidilutea]